MASAPARDTRTVPRMEETPRACPALLRTAVGLPRPRVPWTPTTRAGKPTGAPDQPLPSPWINGEFTAWGEWRWLRSDVLAEDVHDRRLCAVCGLTVDGTLVYLRFTGPGVSGAWTSGPGAHPVCAVLAARHCPHLIRQLAGDPDTVIGYRWDGPGQGYDLDPDADPWDLYTSELRLRDDVAPVTLAELTALARSGPRPPARCPVAHAAT